MRKLALLPLLAFLASCGSEPEPLPRWRDPGWRSVDAACERYPDWSDGLSLEELLVCVERRGPVRVAREVIERAQALKDETRTFPSFPFEVSGVRPSRRDDRTISGAMVRHVFDIDGRWEKRQGALAAEIELARWNADDLRSQVLDHARCSYWTAVAAERRLAILQEGPITLDEAGAPGPDAEHAVTNSAGTRDETRVAERQSAAAREEIEALVGGDAPPSWTLSDPFPAGGPEIDLQRAIAVARLHRTRLAALAAAAAEAHCRLDQIEAEAAPDPGIGVSYSIERDRNSASFDFHDAQSSAFVGFSLTLPVRPHNHHVISGATAETRATLQARSAAEADVVPEVTGAVVRYGEARARLAPAGAATPSAKREAINAQLEFAIARSRLECAVGRPVEEYSR